MACPFCNHDKAWKNGHRNGLQRWLCTNCGREYIDNTSKSRQVRKDQTKVINMPSSDLFLVSETEKHPQKVVSGRPDTESEDAMEIHQLQKSDLLKVFPTELQAKIIEFAIKRENQGYRDTKNVVSTLKTLFRTGADLYDPENVKAAIRRLKVKDATKQVYCDRYGAFLKFLGGTWEKPRYRITQRIPFIPLKTEIDQLIAALSPMVSTFCQIALETAARRGEIARLKWTDIDFERHLIFLNDPEKGSNPRVIKISEKCLNMINRISRNNEKLFSSLKYICNGFYRQRRQIAHHLSNLRMMKITLHTFRHWKATEEYHKTKDILHVQRLLGHKSIKSTMVYINIEQTIFKESDDEFTVRVTDDLQEYVKLLEVGFEYISDYGNKKILRKRK